MKFGQRDQSFNFHNVIEMIGEAGSLMSLDGGIVPRGPILVIHKPFDVTQLERCCKSPDEIDSR